jgi:hypothetical protein
VKIGGLLHSHADITFPFSMQRGLTPEEDEDLKVILRENPDFIMCRNVKDHRFYAKIKTAFYEESNTMKPFICAPSSGLKREHVEKICQKFDGIWLSEANEIAVKKCRKLYKPVLMSLTGDREFIARNVDAVLYTNDVFRDKRDLHFFSTQILWQKSRQVSCWAFLRNSARIFRKTIR